MHGYVSGVTPIKNNLQNSCQNFMIHVKVKRAEFKKVLVSNHHNLQQVRSQFLVRFHNKEPVIIKNVKPGQEVLYYNSYSAIEVASYLDFNINESDAMQLADVNEVGQVLSVVGKIRFVGDIESRSTGRRNERMRNTVICDGSRTMKLTLWSDFVDMIHENELIQLYCPSTRIYEEQLQLYTTYGTSVCFLTEELEVEFDPGLQEADPLQADDPSILCEKVIGLKVEHFYSCLICSKRMMTVPGTCLLRCNSCPREWQADFIKSVPKCRMLIVDIDVIKNDGTLMSVTIFKDVLSTIVTADDLENEAAVKAKVFNLKDFVLVIDKKKNVVTSINI